MSLRGDLLVCRSNIVLPVTDVEFGFHAADMQLMPGGIFVIFRVGGDSSADGCGK